MRIKLRIHETPGHQRITVFIGPDLEHLANAGDLVLRTEEVDDFVNSFRLGADVVVDRIPQP